MSSKPMISLLRRGKVRDVYAILDPACTGASETLLMVATNRMSALDWPLAERQPRKAYAVTAMTKFWHDILAESMPTDLISWQRSYLPTTASAFAGRALLVRKLDMIQLECVVRGYLYGTALKEYIESGTVCGTRLPPGMRKADRLAEPIFTPTLKSQVGHDVNISLREAADIAGDQTLRIIHDYAIKAYRVAATYAERRGLIIADTKFEFGRRGSQIVLADELFTSDSSRIWLKARWRPGEDPPSLDRQHLKDWLLGTGWDQRSRPPRVPRDVIHKTSDLYVQAYELISGERLTYWLRQARS